MEEIKTKRQLPIRVLAKKMLDKDTMLFSVYFRIWLDDEPIEMNGFRYVVSADELLPPGRYYGKASSLTVRFPINTRAAVKNKARMAYYRRFHADALVSDRSDVSDDTPDD